MIKTIVVDGKEVNFKVTAATPRVYRLKFGRDLFADIQGYVSGEFEESEKHSIIENFAFVMAWQFDNTIKGVDEWLDTFDNPSAVIKSAPNLLTLWGVNIFSLSAGTTKKKVVAK